MNSKKFYVYGLVDPRTKTYFYIGKGKGKRYRSHLKYNRLDFNLGKLDTIKEIRSNGMEVEINILFSNLDEETAYKLEEIIIYKLGRRVFGEGILTNINPGGRWKPGNKVLYDEKLDTDFDVSQLDFLSQIKFKEIKEVSKFNYLNTAENLQHLYLYDHQGNFEKKINLNDLFPEGVKGYEIELFRELRQNNKPIFGRWIYSKFAHNKIYVSKYFPFKEFDIIDEEFHKQIDENILKGKDFELVCKIDSITRFIFQQKREIIKLTSFYNSGRKKSLRKIKGKRLNGVNLEWFENGHISVKEERLDNYKDYIRTTYYEENGGKHIRVSRIGENKGYERWFVNGETEVNYIENIGYIYYNEKGEKIRLVEDGGKTTIYNTV